MRELKIKLPATVTKLEPYALYCLTMKEINVNLKYPIHAKEGQCIYEKYILAGL